MRKHINILVNILAGFLLWFMGTPYIMTGQQVVGSVKNGRGEDTLPYQPVDDAAGGGVVDTVHPKYQLDEIVVTAFWFAPPLKESPSSATVLAGRDLSLAAPEAVSDALEGVTGVNIKDYGGASALKTISQRGLGAEHTLVLLNGLRISSFQNGLVDLGLISPGDLERVEIIQGGLSAAHGSDAMGGAVNLVTRPPGKVPSASVESSFGSFGYQKFRVVGEGGWMSGGIRASVTSERGREDYPFVFHNGPSEVGLLRTNADFSSRYATLETAVRPSDGSLVRIFGRAFRSERGAAGPVVSPSSTSLARQTDEDYLGQVVFASGGDGDQRFQAAGQVRSTYQRYQDPMLRIASASGLDTYFKNNDYRGTLSWSSRLARDFSLHVGGEGAATRADGMSLATALTRWQGSSFVSGEYMPVSGHSVIQRVTLYPSVRFDSFTGASPAWSPGIAALMRFQEMNVGESEIGTHLRGSLTRNFRIPTFNELYYAGGGGFGNPYLHPELSTGYDVGGGISATFLGWQELSVSWFSTTVADRIVWVAAGGFGVTPRNIREVESSGIELSWLWRPAGELVTTRLNYSKTRSIKTSQEGPADVNMNTSLVYVPDQSANASIVFGFPVDLSLLRRVEGVAEYHFVGLRYTNEDNSGALPSYEIVNAGFLLFWETNPWRANIRFDVHNILDAHYQVILGYPMPARSYRITLTLGLS